MRTALALPDKRGPFCSNSLCAACRHRSAHPKKKSLVIRVVRPHHTFNAVPKRLGGSMTRSRRKAIKSLRTERRYDIVSMLRTITISMVGRFDMHHVMKIQSDAFCVSVPCTLLLDVSLMMTETTTAYGLELTANVALRELTCIRPLTRQELHFACRGMNAHATQPLNNTAGNKPP